MPADAMHSGGTSPYVPGRYLLRIHAMGDMDAIASELTWLAALNQEAGLAVPAPVQTADGKLFINPSTPGIPNGRVVSLMRWLDGRKITQRIATQTPEGTGRGCRADA